MLDLTMIDLTFAAHLQVPTYLCPTFSLCKPGSIFSTLETASETLAHYLLGVGLTEINSFLVLPPLPSLPLDFVSRSGQTWSVWDRQSQVSLHSCASATEHWLDYQGFDWNAIFERDMHSLRCDETALGN